MVNEDSDFIVGIDELFNSIVLPSKCPDTECLEGLLSGSLAILWKKSLYISFKLEAVHDNFMVAALSTDNRCLGLVNVYMPYDGRTIDVMNEYFHVLGELQP